MTTPTIQEKTPPPHPLELYLSSLELRDQREKKHEKYINAFTKLADKAALAEKGKLMAEREALQNAPKEATEASTPESKARPAWRYYPSSSSKSSPTPATPVEPTLVARMRADLSATNNIRIEQEAQIAHLTSENSLVKATNAELEKTSKQRITELENKNKLLERKVKDFSEETKGKSKLAEQIQDDLLVLQMEMNAKDRTNEGLKADNEELRSRWMAAKLLEAQKMNEEAEKGQRK